MRRNWFTRILVINLVAHGNPCKNFVEEIHALLCQTSCRRYDSQPFERQLFRKPEPSAAPPLLFLGPLHSELAAFRLVGPVLRDQWADARASSGPFDQVGHAARQLVHGNWREAARAAADAWFCSPPLLLVQELVRGG